MCKSGAQVGGYRIVNQGLKRGDRVVVGGMQYARQGATVKPTVVAASTEER